MKKCFKCGKEYDNSFKICPQCGAPFVDPNLSGQEDVRSEIDDARREIGKLNERLNRIEYIMSLEKRESAPKKAELFKKQEVKETERKESSIQVKTDIPKEKLPETKVERKKRTFSESFEQRLGGKLFNKLGILAVVIGVALLIGHSFKYLGPVGKISIGFAFGFGMILFGHYIEKKENLSIYGKTLAAGGWAITYFTAFAAHHIPSVRLIENAFFGMLLLLCVSFVTIVDIYRYKSQVATAFSYLLVFITFMISPISWYTMAASIPVAISLVFFMYKMKWMEFGLYGMAMTYVTYLSWFKIAQKYTESAMTTEQFFMAAVFLILYWAIFVIAALLIKDSKEKPADFGMRELIFFINILVTSFIGWALLNAGFLKHLIPSLVFAASLYLGLAIVTYLMRKRFLYIISSTSSVAFAAIFLLVKYSGYSLTVHYILLTQLVLLAGIIFKEAYWRVLSFTFLIIVAAKLLLVDSFFVSNTKLFNHLSSRGLLFTFAFIVYLINHILYSRPKIKGLISGVEKNHLDVISYIYPLIYAMGTWLDLPKVLTAPCWVMLGVILLQIGVLKNNRHQRIQGYILTIGAFARLLMSNMLISGGVSIFSYRVITSLPVIIILYYCAMLLRDENTRGIFGDSEKKMVFLYPYMFFILVMFLIWYEAPKNFIAPAWGLIAVAYAIRGARAKENVYFSISSLAAISACMRALFANILRAKYLVGSENSVIYSIFTIAVLYVGNIVYLRSKGDLNGGEAKGKSKIKIFLRSSRFVYGLAATTLLTALILIKLSGVLLTIALGAEGLILFLFGFGLKEKYWRMFGLIILLFTLLKAFLVDMRQIGTLYYILSLIILGITLLFVSYMYTKHRDKIKKLI
ncbi:MAG: DUF2339 domain-containing protein [Candidatus Omnitrophota bacterium]